jgi:dephospho-CoA kinase
VRLRSVGGIGALAQQILPRFAGHEVVDSIRHPGEVAVFRTLDRFVLLGIDAPLRLRFERSVARGRVGDGTTLDEFARQEARENSSAVAGQQLRATFELADAVIRNDGRLEGLAGRIREALIPIGLGDALPG